jgi:hypothetical protein
MVVYQIQELSDNKQISLVATQSFLIASCEAKKLFGNFTTYGDLAKYHYQICVKSNYQVKCNVINQLKPRSLIIDPQFLKSPKDLLIMIYLIIV